MPGRRDVILSNIDDHYFDGADANYSNSAPLMDSAAFPDIPTTYSHAQSRPLVREPEIRTRAQDNHDDARVPLSALKNEARLEQLEEALDAADTSSSSQSPFVTETWSSNSSRALVVRNIRQAFRENFKPALVLQGFAALLLFAYYSSPAVEATLTKLGDVKTDAGYLFSAVSTSLFGGVLPFLVTWLRLFAKDERYRNRRYLSRQFSFFALFWAFKGVEVDALYRLQAVMFGTDANFQTIAPKVAVDMFVYNPVYATASCIFAQQLADVDFSWSAWRAGFDRRKFWTITFPTTLLTVWMVWGPCVAIIYSLPPPLQIPLFELVLVFWVLMLQLLASAKGTKETPASAGPDTELEMTHDGRTAVQLQKSQSPCIDTI